MERKLIPELNLDSEKLRKDYNKFLDEVGIYFLILRIERDLTVTPIEKHLGITRGVIRQIEAGKFNWNISMLEDIWNYYYSVQEKWDILSRFKAKHRDSLLARLIKMGQERSKWIQRNGAREAEL